METLTRLQVSSPAFEYGEKIPVQHTCDGRNINPTLEIDDLPERTQSLVVMVNDPDAPSGTWSHWLMWDIAPTNLLEEGSAAGTQGLNDFGNPKYNGPCPPIGTHRYFFRVYALDTMLRLPEASTREELLEGMANHILASGELMGVFSR
ncbi:YbhB/YbcL family Raf kinase inhibitor-like protein [Pontibacter actiniarum]|uniref:Phosphatidylethanolamine-binding protein n=1 Tax=Pontibacter actiniarum TaxID=323450 RepID=A0A1X9YXQ1_9BACT|nr:YbhB/YbcL family Raf kinase inhibitor-like protein [Pontibacter actiniarum]ARS37716.1 phosphatidylethanolamine-binding protein [Pontibacter actiniarum]